MEAQPSAEQPRPTAANNRTVDPQPDATRQGWDRLPRSTRECRPSRPPVSSFLPLSSLFSHSSVVITCCCHTVPVGPKLDHPSALWASRHTLTHSTEPPRAGVIGLAGGAATTELLRRSPTVSLRSLFSREGRVSNRRGKFAFLLFPLSLVLLFGVVDQTTCLPTSEPVPVSGRQHTLFASSRTFFGNQTPSQSKLMSF